MHRSVIAIWQLLILLTMVSLACPAAGHAEAAETTAIWVNVTRLDSKHWQAQYLLPQPVLAVQFRRGADLKRERTWQLNNPELQFQLADGQLQIRARDGRPFAAFTVQFPEQAFFLNRDYTFHVSNADGSLLLFTGQLYVDLLSRAQSTSETAERPFAAHQLLLNPLTNESVLIDGQQRSGMLSWLDAEGAGTYAYFGNGKRQETENGFAIVDAAAPAWARQLVADFVPQLFAHYRQRFGFAPREKPTVTLSYQPDPNFSSYNGGLLGNVIQLSIQGAQYAEASEAAIRDLRELIAHEAAHFWQWAVLTRGSDEDHRYAWVHEGGADAAAARAQLELGLLTPAQYHAEAEQALNSCLQQVQGIVLADAFKQRRGKAYYDCGAALSFVLQQYRQQHAETFTVFEQWQLMWQLQQHTPVQNRPEQNKPEQNNAKLFWRMLANSELAPELRSAVQQFVEQEHVDSLADMKQLLSVGKLAFHLDNQRAPASAHFEQARRWMSALMAGDCAGAISFYSNLAGDEGPEFAIEGLPQCRQLHRNLQIRQLAGSSLTAPALDAAVRQRCTDNATVSVTTTAGELSLTCPESMPTPLQWLSLPEPAALAVRP